MGVLLALYVVGLGVLLTLLSHRMNDMYVLDIQAHTTETPVMKIHFATKLKRTAILPVPTVLGLKERPISTALLATNIALMTLIAVDLT